MMTLAAKSPKKDSNSPGEFPITQAMGIIRRQVKKYPTPVITVLSEESATPYEILISTILSLRTQDKTTGEATARLFEEARTPQDMGRLRPATIAKAIYPVGFYRTKATTILEVSQTLLNSYGGQVPDDVEELILMKGVGRKTANLVVTLGHGKPGICVDTHVHRIANRWGYVHTKAPDKTEVALRAKLPRRYWIPINDWLVTWGQNVCKPTSPLCSQCPLDSLCPRLDVARSR